jgi:hypothetical protein
LVLIVNAKKGENNKPVSLSKPACFHFATLQFKTYYSSPFEDYLPTHTRFNLMHTIMPSKDLQILNKMVA